MSHPVTIMREGVSDTIADHLFKSFGDAVGFATSGTTGEPKKIIHHRRSVLENADAFNIAVDAKSDTRMYHCMPLDYMAGYLNTLACPLRIGGTVVIGPKFSPINFWEIPVAQKCNTMWLTPTMAASLVRMVRDADEAKRSASGFRNIFCGTAPLSNSLREQWLNTFGVPLQESYGTSELLIVSVQRNGSTTCDAGHTLPFVTAKMVADDDGNEEIVVATPFAAAGYIHPDGTLEDLKRIHLDFAKTGDVGVVENNRISITGRIKDLIIRGGINVNPVVVENTIKAYPWIADAAVVGVADDYWGEKIRAYLQLNSEASAEALYDTVVPRATGGEAWSLTLPRSHWPDEFVYVKEFPRNASGKIQKQKLVNS